MVDLDLIKEITDENKKLRETLEYYADPKNWTAKQNIAQTDRGEMARKTLKGDL